MSCRCFCSQGGRSFFAEIYFLAGKHFIIRSYIHEYPRDQGIQISKRCFLNVSPQSDISKSEPTSRVGLQDLWHLFKHNFVLIFCFVAVGMALTAAVVFSISERYVATSVIVLETGNTAFDTVSSRLRVIDPSVAQTEVEVLRSRQFAESIAERMELFDDPDFAPSLGDNDFFLSRLFRFLQPGGSGSTINAATSGEAVVTTEASDPAEPLDESDLEALNEADRIAQYEALQREAVIDKLLGIYSINYPGHGLAIRIESTYEDPVFAARVSNVVARTYIEEGLRRQRLGIDSAINFLRKRSVTAIENLTTRQAELAALIRLNALDDSNRTEAMLAELESLRAIADLEEQGEGSDLARQIQQRTDALRQRTRAELERAQLELALQIDQQRYQSIFERLNDYEAQRDSLTPTARQITVAQPPRKPSEPQRVATLAVAFVVLSFFAFIYVLFREQMNAQIWTVDSAEEASGLPVLAQIPRLPRSGAGARGHLIEHLSAAPYSAFGQAARSLATSALARTDTDKGAALMVLSALPNEGKSTVSVALSACAAHDGLRVILIDLDVQQQSASALLGVPNSDLALQDAFDSFETFRRGISTCSQYPQLDVINFGPTSHFGLKLRADRSEETRIENYLRKTYDLIVIDTPSYLATENANRFAEFADVAVVVARAGQTRERALRAATHAMRSKMIPLVGVALNAVGKR